MSAQALPKNGQPSSSKSGSSNSNSNSNNYRSKAPPRLHAAKTANEKPDISIPQARRIAVDTTGAQIVQEESPATRDSRSIYLPHYIEPVSHIAIDIGGSLAKVVYFTRQTKPIPRTPPESGPSSPFLPPAQSVSPSALASSARLPDESNPETFETRRPHVNGTLTPQILSQVSADYLSSRSTSSLTGSGAHTHRLRSSISTHPKLRRSSAPQPLPGGVLNFARFETANIDELIAWLNELISTSAAQNRVSMDTMRSTVKVMVTGGGAYMYYDRLKDELEVEVKQEEEMECLITGLGFVARVPEEVFWFSDALVYKVSHSAPAVPAVDGGQEAASSSSSSQANGDVQVEETRAGEVAPESSLAPPQQLELERPSPTPPQYSVTFAPISPIDDTDEHVNPNFPCLLVNIGSGVSIVKVDENGKFERVSGTSLGGGTLWGLLSLLTDARSFDEMLLLSEKGDNAAVDMLVGDIYGSDYSKIGLKSSTIASTFGKVFKKGQSPEERKKAFRQEDVARSLLYAISNNIGHVAYMNAAKYGLDKVFFGGCFIRATISTLSYAIRFWSKGTMRACFLRHEGFLGSIGAWIKNVEPGSPDTQQEEEEER